MEISHSGIFEMGRRKPDWYKIINSSGIEKIFTWQGLYFTLTQIAKKYPLKRIKVLVPR
jgi:hypothetical protein